MRSAACSAAAPAIVKIVEAVLDVADAAHPLPLRERVVTE